MNAIEFVNVTFRYPLYHHLTRGIKPFILNFPRSLIAFKKDRYTALENVTFHVGMGEKIGIIGRNGAGKSTTLGLIAGVLKPAVGYVKVNARVSPFLELGAGFHPELTGRENILLNGILMGLRKDQVLNKIDEIINFADLGNFIDQPIRIYSSGMLTRLGFSVVSSLDPEILLIDEVLAVGDLVFRKKCIDRIEKFKNSDTTIVFVSHSLDDVTKLCTRAIWIDKHSVEMIGKSEDVVEKYNQRMNKLEP